MSRLAFALSLITVGTTTAKAQLQWTSCPGSQTVDCATLEVPLEHADPTSGATAQIPLVRYNATVSAAERKGSLLTNPGGPGASGAAFVLNGAGEAISTITGGLYDIIGWDPRGVASARPLLQCFATAGDEYAAANALPAAAELAYSQFGNASYAPDFDTALGDFDTAVATLADACATYNSSALYTSSAAYVVRDMAAIVDALDGPDAPLNYWGFSYGTIFGAEFIQTYPERAGRLVFDGVFDAAANAQSYDVQLPNDQLSVRDAINDLVSYCEQAGADGCALATPPAGVTADLATRLDDLQQSLYTNPIVVSDSVSITIGIFSAFMWSFSRLPTTWSLIASAVSGLEKGDPSTLVSILSSTAASAPTDASAPDGGSLAVWPLQCVDNAPSSHISLAELGDLVLNISFTEDTPWLNADLTPVSFCRNFPDTRPRIPNLGASKLAEVDSILAQQQTPVLIVNAEHDPVTPLESAQRLHQMLPTSSRLALRRGPGHTTVSLGSLGLAQDISRFFIAGTLPTTDGATYDINQAVFSPDIEAGTATPSPVFNGTYSADEQALLQATYAVLLAFISIA